MAAYGAVDELNACVGLALAATSIAFAVTAPPTPDVSRVVDPQGYVDRAKRTDAAFLLGVTSAPLLTMPLPHAVVFPQRVPGVRSVKSERFPP